MEKKSFLLKMATRIGPKASSRRKIRRKRNRQWWRNQTSKIYEAANVSIKNEVVHGYDCLITEINGHRNLQIMYGRCVNSDALKLLVS